MIAKVHEQEPKWLIPLWIIMPVVQTRNLDLL